MKWSYCLGAEKDNQSYITPVGRDQFDKAVQEHKGFMTKVKVTHDIAKMNVGEEMQDHLGFPSTGSD